MIDVIAIGKRTRLTRAVLHALGVVLLAVSLAACGGSVQDDYYEDEGSPSQGAPLDGGELEPEDFEEEDD